MHGDTAGTPHQAPELTHRRPASAHTPQGPDSGISITDQTLEVLHKLQSPDSLIEAFCWHFTLDHLFLYLLKP